MNGIILINKEKGYTSHDVVSKVKKILNVKKVGHTGTLDPNATGVLSLLINDGTKLSKYLINHDKEYIATLKLGIKTDTADIEGNIIEKKEVKSLNEKQVIDSLKSFVGKNSQIPPMYSAIKVDGKKLYEYAREGQKIDLKTREIEIYEIELLSINDEKKEIIFKVKCSKGTYIRSLCEDIATKLGTVGYMKDLQRTVVGNFKIEDSITLNELEKLKEENNINEINKKIITMKELLKYLPTIKLEDNDVEKFLNGVKIFVNKEDGIYNIYTESYLGTGIVENKKVKRDIII